MPIYEYACTECGHEFESLIMNQEEAEQVQCPKCDSREVRKALSAFAVGSKGEGAPPACGDSGTCPSGTCPYR
jgi:putative FmdB family regulatory protein